MYLAAINHVRENIENLDGRVSARDTDLLFLKSLVESPVLNSLVKVQEQLEETFESTNPVCVGNYELLEDVREICSEYPVGESQELLRLLDHPHFEAMIEAHDMVAEFKSLGLRQETPFTYTNPSSFGNTTVEDFQIVGIRKADEEPLGITVRTEEDGLVVSRILAGGTIDRQGLLNVGDTILEVNGNVVRSHTELQKHLLDSVESVTFKIRPSHTDNIAPTMTYVKTLFAYDPSKDSLLPCKEIGLSFKQGDILQILNQEDPNWWQAKRLDSSGHAGLIPSQDLEERRRAFVRPEFNHATKSTMCGTKITKKKKKILYQSKSNCDFDKAELIMYEEVATIPQCTRNTLILLGVQGVGRRSIKNRLIKDQPNMFGAPIPHTSRPMRETETDGRNYHFVRREEMEADIAENKYLEHGETNGHLYGTKLESIRDIIRSGKICILDCSPQAVKILKTSEFRPFVIFLAAPPLDHMRNRSELAKLNSTCNSRNLTFDRAMGRYASRRARTTESLASLFEEEDFKKKIEESARLQRAYERYFDLVLVNIHFEKTYEQVSEAIDALSTEPQWIPISWIY